MSDITYGVKSAITGNFLFGIREPTEREACAALSKAFGRSSKWWPWGFTIAERPPEGPKPKAAPEALVKQTRIIRWVERGCATRHKKG